jgi:hypothetical protein
MHRLTLSLLLLLTGCASLNQQECQTLSPAALGRMDGRQGYGLWRLEKHIDSCARFGIPFEREPYLQARKQGLLFYCTAENGERVGLRGESYEGVCPPELEAGFLQRYRPAIHLYRADRQDPWNRFGGLRPY